MAQGGDALTNCLNSALGGAGAAPNPLAENGDSFGLDTERVNGCDDGCDGLLFWWIDPDGVRHGRRARCDAFEASRVCREGADEGDTALCGERGRAAVVYGIGRHQGDAGVTVLGVVPREELSAVRSCILDRAESCREVGPVLQGFEVRLGIRVVV